MVVGRIWVGITLQISLFTVLNAKSSEKMLEFFDEKLDIYRFQNNLALLDFEYSFSKE